MEKMKWKCGSCKKEVTGPRYVNISLKCHECEDCYMKRMKKVDEADRKAKKQ